jgi:hypothetical protein
VASVFFVGFLIGPVFRTTASLKRCALLRAFAPHGARGATGRTAAGFFCQWLRLTKPAQRTQ